MTYDRLLHFIRTRMRMSHVYPPVMLMPLLEKKGRTSIRDIASAILVRDESQIQYYEQITKNGPDRRCGPELAVTIRFDGTIAERIEPDAIEGRHNRRGSPPPFGQASAARLVRSREMC
jgi:hypothetical protein